MVWVCICDAVYVMECVCDVGVMQYTCVWCTVCDVCDVVCVSDGVCVCVMLCGMQDVCVCVVQSICMWCRMYMSVYVCDAVYVCLWCSVSDVVCVCNREWVCLLAEGIPREPWLPSPAVNTLVPACAPFGIFQNLPAPTWAAYFSPPTLSPKAGLPLRFCELRHGSC